MRDVLLPIDLLFGLIAQLQCQLPLLRVCLFEPLLQDGILTQQVSALTAGGELALHLIYVVFVGFAVPLNHSQLFRQRLNLTLCCLVVLLARLHRSAQIAQRSIRLG